MKIQNSWTDWGVGLASRPLVYTIATETITRTFREPNGTVLEGDAYVNDSIMTTVGQTRRGADRLITSFTSAKRTIRIGNWNVRSMFQTGKTAIISKEMTKYKISILGISETWWPGCSSLKLNSGELLLFSGTEDGTRRKGVGLLLNKEAQNSLSEWTPINDRIITAKFLSNHADLVIIQCYAPTSNADDGQKDAFYEALDETIRKFERHGILLVQGDFNGKIGNENENGTDRVMGKEGLGAKNEGGKRLIELCVNNDLFIGGSAFAHKDIHQYTWTSPDGNTRNQIDHVCIIKRWRRSLLDVRTRRGADVASDHELVISKIKVKLHKVKKSGFRRGKFNIEKLKQRGDTRDFQT